VRVFCICRSAALAPTGVVNEGAMSGLKPPTYGERVVEGLMSGLKPPTYGGIRRLTSGLIRVGVLCISYKLIHLKVSIIIGLECFDEFRR
jgi:hypothetical protein